MVSLEVLNPVAKLSTQEVTFASRLGDLSGKTIGLLWNNKPGGDTVNQFTAELLAERFSGTRFRNYYGSMGIDVRHVTAEDVNKMAKECDAIVGSVAD